MYKLRDYQEQAVNAPFEFWRSGGDHGLIVAPTGSGKSVIIAGIISRIWAMAKNTPILVLTHRKELLEQNEETVNKYDQSILTGIYSAGLKRKEITAPVLFAGVQSIQKRVHQIDPPPAVVIIDESHLVSQAQDTQYQKTVETIKLMNPKVKFIGFTATPYRLGVGYIHKMENAIFNDVIYEIEIETLIKQGHLSKLITRGGHTKISTAGVHKRKGEFIGKELEAVAMREGTTPQIIKEVIHKSIGRKKWIFFTCGIDHAHQVADELRENDISVEVVTSKTKNRDKILKDYKAGEFTALVNVDVLTTGFNAPDIDLLVMMRPTESTALYVQILGRGMRTAPGKENCLVLDHAGNIARHGALNDLTIKEVRKKDEEPGVPPIKECPDCGAFEPPAVRVCTACGYEWPPPQPKLETKAHTGDLIADKIKEWKVLETSYHLHRKVGKPDSLRIEYTVEGSIHPIKEWQFPEAKNKFYFYRFCKEAGAEPVDNAAEWTMKYKGGPIGITTKKEGKYFKIICRRWADPVRNVFQDEPEAEQLVRYF